MSNEEKTDHAALQDDSAATTAQTSQATAQLQTRPLDASQLAAESQQTQEIAQQESDDDDAALAALQKMEERRKKKRRKRLITLAIVLGVFLLLIGSCVAATMAALPSAMQSLAPETVTVERGNLSATVQGTGNLKAGSQVAVTPEVSGIIQEVMVTEGQLVEKGDVLFTLKNDELEKALQDADAAVGKAARGLDDANNAVARADQAYSDAVDAYNESVDKYEEQSEKARKAASAAYDKAYAAAIAAIPATATEAERAALKEQAELTAETAAAEAAASVGTAVDPGKFDHTAYVNAVESAQSAANSAADSLADAERAYGYAKEQADKRTVRAAASGSILALTATPGAAVGGATGGTSTASGPLAQIADLSTISVDVEVNEIDVSDVKVGQQAQVTFTAIPGLELQGTVKSVASVASNANAGSTGTATGAGTGVVTFKATTVIDQPDNRLRPGMSSNVKIVTKVLENVLLVPSAAVTEEGETAYVNVPTGQDGLQTERREVVVAGRTTSQVAIESGLQEGERVVVSNPIASLASSNSGA